MITADELLQREAGCDFGRAMLLCDLQSAAEAALEEYREYPEAVPDEWLAAVKLIAETELQLFEVTE